MLQGILPSKRHGLRGRIQFRHPIAAALIHTWMRFSVQDITASILTQALDIKATHGFSYWDSAIIAAARALGCRRLYSEDMAHGRDVEGVVILNPFRNNA